MKTIGILYSGGLDSFLMYKYFHSLNSSDKLKCVYYDIGQEYNYKELESIKQSGVDVTIKKVEWLSSESELIAKDGSLSGNIIIPGRNMILASLIACQYEVDEIWLGALMGEIHDKSTDKNLTFIEKWNDLARYVLQKDIKIRFPFVDLGWSKRDLVANALKNNWVNKEQLLKTSSCLSGEKNNCGKCVVCFRRWGIFKQLGFEEQYNTHPLDVIVNLKMSIIMIDGELTGECHYDKYRRDEILPALLITFETNDLIILKQLICEKLELLEQKEI